MESTGALPGLSFAKKLRNGQRRVLSAIEDEPSLAALNVRLPTGYGKTLAAAVAYSALKQHGRVDRLLYIVPTTAQLDQFVREGVQDFKDAGVSGPPYPFDISANRHNAVRNNRTDKTQIFACTVQALTHDRSATMEVLRDLLLRTHKWMIVVDEYHHYGLDKTWGKVIMSLDCAFRLAMSATPYRKDSDEAFGKPDIEMLYREACEEEKALKMLECHSYVYLVELEMPNGEIKTFTTEEVAHEAGSDAPEDIERMRIERSMRWSPKYISPLVDIPLGRLQRTRLATGLPCQALIGAMCCSHAEFVCKQIRAMFPELRVDWVGTGPNGRLDNVNEEVIQRFLPEKVDGRRRPSDVKLDVLVHVGKAGEGLDSVFVTEIVHLNRAGLNNQNNQENGRAARLLPDTEWKWQVGYINVDSSSEYAPYVGKKVMDAIDQLPLSEDDGPPEPRDPGGDLPLLPIEPRIFINNMECIRVDRGEIERMAQAIEQWGKEGNPAFELDWRKLEDLESPDVQRIINICRKMRHDEAEQFNVSSVLEQWREKVNAYVGPCAQRCARIACQGKPANQEHMRKLIGTYAKLIAKRKCEACGPVEKCDVDQLKKHWSWLRQFDAEVATMQRLPSWLMLRSAQAQ